MVKATMIKWYEHFSPVDAYLIGFVYKKSLYAIALEKIPPRYMKVEHESSKKGGAQKLQLRLNNAYMEQLIRKGAECLGSADMLEGQYNKGVEFERIMTERSGQAWRGKDNVGFWGCGDLEVDGKQYQIKLNGAQIVVETTLERLKARAR